MCQKNLQLDQSKMRKEAARTKRTVLVISVAVILMFLWYIGKSEQDISTSIGFSLDSKNVIKSSELTGVARSWWAKDLWCYGADSNVELEFDTNGPVIGGAIFFHLTSCPQAPGDVDLNARQACAIESAAIHHPEKEIYLLSVAPIPIPLNDTKNEALRTLLTYNNFKIRHINFESYLDGTPMKKLIAPLQRSQWAVPHASDLLRYTTLYKFRGIYLDLDVIVIKRMPSYSNYVGAESETSLGAGVIGFGADTVGLDMARDCANEIANTFNGNDWGNNGPGVITRVLYRRCNKTTAKELWGLNCKGYRISPPSHFYAIHYLEHALFFDDTKLGLVRRKLKNSYLVHYWNKFTSSLIASRHGVPFYEYANRNCPKVFDSVNGAF